MKTLKDLRDHVKADLDLEDEEFITDDDINRWINEAIKSAEQQIHTLYEDYFLAQSTIPITTGQNLYDYPSDIYANKIRKIIFNDGLSNTTSSHVVKRIKNLVEAAERDYYTTDSVNPILRWSPINDSSNGRKIRVFPSSSRGGNLDVWYIRNANVLSADTDVCDIDEFEHYIVQYAKTQAFIKDNDPRADDSKILEEQYKADMVMTLSTMSPDNDNELPPDFTHYNETVDGYFGEDC